MAPGLQQSDSWPWSRLAIGTLIIAMACVVYIGVDEFVSASDSRVSQETDQTGEESKQLSVKPTPSADPTVNVSVSETATTSFAQLTFEDINSKTIPVYFASQSGTAEAFAEEVVKFLTKSGLKAIVIDLENFDSTTWVGEDDESLVTFAVLVLATYGEGEAPDNAAKFNQWLESANRNPNCLTHLRYAMMGLGNRQYQHFNGMSRRTHFRMQQLGGRSICPVGEGDDDQDVEADFTNWMNNIFTPIICGTLISNIMNGSVPADESTDAQKVLREMNFDLLSKIREGWKRCARAPLEVLVGSSPEELLAACPKCENTVGCDLVSRMHFTSVKGEVSKLRNLLQETESMDVHRSVKHIEITIELTQPGAGFSVADNVDIFPANNPEDVEWFMNRLVVVDSGGRATRVSINDFIHFVDPSADQSRTGRPFPTPCRLLEALTYRVELGSLPMKSQLRDFALSFVVADEEKLRISKLLDDKHSGIFKDLIKNSCFTLREFVCLLIPSAVLDLGGFLQLTARQRPRSYTICTSPLVDQQVVGLTVTRLIKQLPPLATTAFPQLRNERLVADDVGSWKCVDMERKFRGVCSNYLCCDSFVDGHMVHLSIRPSSFASLMSRNAGGQSPLLSKSIVMIAAGTGIAPFRGFLEHWMAEQRTKIHSSQLKPNRLLFFGCRNEEDFLYKHEVSRAVEAGILSHVVSAFSRQEPKSYVQDKFPDWVEVLISILVKDEGHLVVCGATKMGKAVGASLELLLKDRVGSGSVVEHLKREGRYVEELWTD